MKMKLIMACIILVLSAAAAQANPGNKISGGYDGVIKDFIESHLTSNHKTLDNVLNDDASVKIPRGETVIVQNKADLVEQMKQIEGAVQNCDATYVVLDKSDAIVIARVDFTYPNCIQHNYITLEKTGDKEWKITQDCKIFNDTDATNSSGTMASLGKP